MGGRHALVIGSQCEGLPGQPLSFLPERAHRLHQVLTDPARGGCAPAASQLVLNPDLPSMAAAVKQAVTGAAVAGATLVVAFVGHAETLTDPTGGADLYLLPKNGVVPPDSDTGYLLGQRLRELLGGPAAVGLDGLLLLVDACHAGVGVLNVAQRAAGLVAAAGVRLELFAATFDRKARDGCFSDTLIQLLEQGLPELSADYIDASALIDRVTDRCRQQEEPLRVAMTRGRRIIGDPGLWLARNPEAAGRWGLAGTAAGGHAVALTRSYQPTDALERVTAAMAGARLTLLVGGAGSGKSALVAALARPELAPDLIPAGYLHAVAFAALTPTTGELADELADQLHRTPGFADAAQRYQAGFDPQDLERQPALQRRLLGPLRALPAPPARRVRIAVDGVDQLDSTVRRDLAGAVAVLTADPGLTVARVLLTTQSAALPDLTEHVNGATRVALERPGPEEAAAYARGRGVSTGLVPFVVAHAHSWLDLQLLADGIATIGYPQLEDFDDLDRLYQARLVIATATLGAEAAPILSVLSAAGSGPVLPVAVAAAACARLGGPPDLPGLRDVLAGLGGLVARANPGTAAEHLGLFHDTLVQHLHTYPVGAVSTEAAHQAILDALTGAEDDPAAASCRALRRPDHLWALRRHLDALTAVHAGLGPQAADNVNTLQPWLDRALAVLGSDHPDTLASRSNLAFCTAESGNVTGAVRLFEELLQAQLRVLGPDHPATLASRNNLAFWTGRSGNVTGAVRLFEELLQAQLRVLGPDHPATLITRNNLAHWTKVAGQAG